MSGKSRRSQGTGGEKKPEAAMAPPVSAPAPSNSEMQEKLKASGGGAKDVYQEAAEKAGFDWRAYDEAHKNDKPKAPPTADEMRKADAKKGLPKLPSDAQGSASPQHWANVQYTSFMMGVCSHEYEVFGAAFNPWKAIADNDFASKADKAKLPKLAKEVAEHGKIALARIDAGLKELDGRHAKVLTDKSVKGMRDTALQLRQNIVMGMERAAHKGPDTEADQKARLEGLANPVDPAQQKGGWAPGAPK